MRQYTLKTERVTPPAGYLNELNAEQRRVVEAGGGPILVIAGAGTGKTRTLTYRAAHLVRQGLEPERLLLLTFTNKAAREMVERVMRLVEAGPPNLRHPLVSRRVSELFEYTGPQNRIVVRYGTEALTHLGSVGKTPRPAGGGYWRCVRLSDRVRRWEAGPLEEIRARVERGELGDEGVVVACFRHDPGYLDSAVKLVKMKSAEYLRLHSLMTECTRVKVFDLLERAGAVGRLMCRRVLEAAGFDWEGMQAAREWAEEYAERAASVADVVATIRRRLDALAGADRKTVALEMKAACADLMPGAFALAMVMHSGGHWQDNAGAMRCDVPVNVYRAGREVPP